MKKLIIISLVLIGLILNACIALKKTDIHSDKIRNQLISNEKIRKETPFIKREFNPYLEDKWIGQAISYGCYRKGQAPGAKGPSESEILEDLEIITEHWNLIRVYNADDDTERILKVIKKNQLPIKVMMGVWLAKEENDSTSTRNNIENSLRAIELAHEYREILVAINVGNETQVFWSGHKMKTENLIRYIRTVRNNTNLPVTTADDYNFWNKPESQKVASEIDFIVTHIYPLWNGKKLENAISWLDKNFNEVKKIHPDKDLVLGEIGWATNYNSEKVGDGQQGTLIKGKVGIEPQGKFLIQLDKWINKTTTTTFLFEAFDEPWKGGGAQTGSNEIEKNWGVFYENRTPKKSFINFINYKNQKN